MINALPLSSSDPDDYYTTIGSVVSPDVDLTSFDSEDNPGSDEQELIYVPAPDPHGFYNPYTQVSVEEYTSQELLGQIASSYVTLIYYNQKALVNEVEIEESDYWVMKVLATVGADIVGFGATFHLQAWQYLDAPYMYNLNEGEESSEEGGEEEGGAAGVLLRLPQQRLAEHSIA